MLEKKLWKIRCHHFAHKSEYCISAEAPYVLGVGPLIIYVLSVIPLPSSPIALHLLIID